MTILHSRGRKQKYTGGDVSAVLPWGKFKGLEVENIPSNYLRWVAEHWREDSPNDRAICRAADKEWQWREDNGEHWETHTGMVKK